jgi:hypothetical protein
MTGTMEAGHSATAQISTGPGPIFATNGGRATATMRGPRTATFQDLGETATVTGSVSATATAAVGAANVATAWATIMADCQENPAVLPAVTVQTDIHTATTTTGSATATATASGTANAVANLNLVIPPLPAPPFPLVGDEIASASSTGTATSSLSGTAGAAVAITDIQGHAELYPNNGGALAVSAFSSTQIATTLAVGLGTLRSGSAIASGEARAGSADDGPALDLTGGRLTANSHASGTASVTGSTTGAALSTYSGTALVTSNANAGDAAPGTPAMFGFPPLTIGYMAFGIQHDAFTTMSGIGAQSAATTSAAGGTNTARVTATASGTTDATANWNNFPPGFNPVTQRSSTDAAGTATAAVVNTNSGIGLVPILPFSPPIPGFIGDNCAQAGIGSVNLVGDESGVAGVIPTALAASGLGTTAVGQGQIAGSRLSSIATVSGANTHANGGLLSGYGGGFVAANSNTAASGGGSTRTVFNGAGLAAAEEGNGAAGLGAQNTGLGAQFSLSGTAAGDGWFGVATGTGRYTTSLSPTASNAHAAVTNTGWVPASGVTASTADSSIRNGALLTNTMTSTGGVEPGATSQFPQNGNIVGPTRWHYDVAYSYTTNNFLGVFT